MTRTNPYRKRSPRLEKLHEIIFEADTPAGKLFDVLLIIAICLSVLVVMLESIHSVRTHYGNLLIAFEWFFTLLFSIEYFLRFISIGKPSRYVFSFYGLVDLLAVLPTYVSLLFPGGRYLLMIRVLRLLRIFRVFKLSLYLKQANLLWNALKASRLKISVFLFSVLTIVLIIGSVMYVVEGEQNGFTSIPTSIYWAIVTLTTVGYGDLSPATPLGKFLASIVMILGYGIIAVPTGIVSVELSRIELNEPLSTQSCRQCGKEGHDFDAKYCKYCGFKL